MDTEKYTDEREVLFELYSFKASNGKTYYIHPATISEILSPDSDFMDKINAIVVPVLTESGNARFQCLGAISDTNRRKYLSEFVSKYVSCGNESVTLESLSEDGFTLDDILLLIKKFAGISG